MSNEKTENIQLFSKRASAQRSIFFGKVLVGVALVETLVIHTILAFVLAWYWNLPLALFNFGSVAWIFYKMSLEPAKTPHELTENTFFITHGRSFRLPVPLTQIAKITASVKKSVPRSGVIADGDTLFITVGSDGNLVEIQLTEPVSVRRKGTFSKIAFNVDEPAELVALLNSKEQPQ